MVIAPLWRLIPWKRLKYPLLLALAVMPGAFLRFFKLGFQSYWYDELITAYWAGMKNLGKIIAAHWSNDVHPPFYQVLVWLWARAFGTSEVALRTFSALVGVLGIVAIYHLGKRLFSKNAGLCAAFLTSANYYHIYYSQEARAYSFVFLLTIASYLCLVGLLRKPAWKTGALYALPTVALLYSHYFGYFILASQLVFLLFVFFDKPESRRWLKYAAFSLVLIAVSVLPWVPALSRLTRMTEFWTQKPEPDFFISYFKSFFGEEPFVLIALILLLIVYFIRRARAAERFEHHGTLLFLWVFVTLFIPYFRSFDSPAPLHTRYAIVVLPALFLMAGRAMDLLKENRMGILFLAAMLVMSVTSIFNGRHYYTVAAKQQWREAARLVMLNDPGNRFVHCGHSLFGQYLGGLYGKTSHMRPFPPDIDSAAAFAAECDRKKRPGVYFLEVTGFGAMTENVREYFGRRMTRTMTASFLAVQVTRFASRPPTGASPEDIVLELKDARLEGKDVKVNRAIYEISSRTRLVTQMIWFPPGGHVLKLRGKIYGGRTEDWRLMIYTEDRARTESVRLGLEENVHRVRLYFPRATRCRLHLEIDQSLLPVAGDRDAVNVRLESLVLETGPDRPAG